MGQVAAIVLAAGRSTRFGADKLLQTLTLDGSSAPLIVHSLRPWLQVFDAVTVVVRPGERALREAAAGLTAVHWVEAAHAELGMGHSLAAGVAANAAAAGWLVGLADMPQVPATAIMQVRAALLQGELLAAPCFEGRRGHPVGFGAAYRDALLALSGDAGARQLLQRDAARLATIAVTQPGILLDIDVPSDIGHLIVDRGEVE